MNITQFIEKLEKLRAEHGDIAVCKCWDGWDRHAPIREHDVQISIYSAFRDGKRVKEHCVSI